MRTMIRWTLVLGLAAWMAGPARAQGPRGGFGGGVMLLSNEGVQKELKLADEQRTKVETLARETGQKIREKMQDLSDDERREKAREISRAANDEARAALKDILSAEQLKRYEQISLQARGAEAFNDSEVQGKLKLSDEQKERLRSIREAAGSQMREVFQSSQGDREEMGRKFQALRRETMEKAAAVLSDAQRKTWKELTGEPFEVRFEPRRRNQQ